MADKFVIMSNFDRFIIPEGETILKDNPMVAGWHTAWNFCGYVWWDPDWELFIEEIWTYKVPRERFAEESLYELVKIVNDKYGWQ
jgi:hypothetical protein